MAAAPVFFSGVRSGKQEGWLAVNRALHKRYFKIENDALVYYATKTSAKPLGSLSLDECEVDISKEQKHGKLFAFELKLPLQGRVYTLDAENDASRQAFVSAIKKTVWRVRREKLQRDRERQREAKDSDPSLSVQYTKPSQSYQLAVKLEKELRGVAAAVGGDKDSASDQRASEKRLPARRQVTHDPDDDGKTPLHWAAHKNWLTVARFLIENKANVEAEDKAGNRAMHEAARGGFDEVVQLLLDSKGSIAVFNKEGATPLHLAAEGSKKEMCRFLLNCTDADVMAVNVLGETPGDMASDEEVRKLLRMPPDKQLPLAAASGLVDDVARIIEKERVNKESTDARGYTALHISAETGHLSVVSYLVKAGASVKATTGNGQTPLHLAVAAERLDVVAFLLDEAGANPFLVDMENRTPLDLAQSKAMHDLFGAVAVRKKSTISLSGARPAVAVAPGSPRQLASSLDTKAPPSPKLGLPLKHVASDGCASVAGSHSLLGLSSPSAAGSGPLSPSLSRASAVLSEAKLQPGRELRHVAQKGFVDEVKRVCTTTEVDVDEPDDKGWTALTYAADAGHLAVVMYLIAKANANVAAVDVVGCQPLHYAAFFCRHNVVKYLVKAKASVNAVDRDGSTPLHHATHTGLGLDVCRELVQSKADLNSQDKKGNTPLMDASFFQHGPIVSYLLEAKANAKLKNKEGKMAVDLIREDLRSLFMPSKTV